MGLKGRIKVVYEVMEIQQEIEPENPLSVSPIRGNPWIKVVVCVVEILRFNWRLSRSPIRGNPWIKVVVCVVTEIQLEIEPESPLSVRPA